MCTAACAPPVTFKNCNLFSTCSKRALLPPMAILPPKPPLVPMTSVGCANATSRVLFGHWWALARHETPLARRSRAPPSGPSRSNGPMFGQNVRHPHHPFPPSLPHWAINGEALQHRNYPGSRPLSTSCPDSDLTVVNLNGISNGFTEFRPVIPLPGNSAPEFSFRPSGRKLDPRNRGARSRPSYQDHFV